MSTMKRATATYNFYSDSGHGWLKVPKAELVQLGIVDQITSYSYVNGDSVYLEEDCDLTTFVKAKYNVGVILRFREMKWAVHSRIRSYDYYTPNKI